ncbi:PEP-utilizing enzyme [Arthrobacter sp. TMN-50]
MPPSPESQPVQESLPAPSGSSADPLTFPNSSLTTCSSAATPPRTDTAVHYRLGRVTETGGELSHAAIVAREAEIPAVLAVPRVTTVLIGPAHHFGFLLQNLDALFPFP